MAWAAPTRCRRSSLEGRGRPSNASVRDMLVIERLLIRLMAAARTLASFLQYQPFRRTCYSELARPRFDLRLFRSAKMPIHKPIPDTSNVETRLQGTRA